MIAFSHTFSTADTDLLIAPDQLPGITPVLRYDDGQSFSSAHSAQSGLRALQILRPCAIKRCENITQSFFGTISIRSSSIFSAVFCLVRPRRWDNLVT